MRIPIHITLCLFGIVFLNCTGVSEGLKLGFGSCHRSRGQTSIWSAIENERLDVWIWGGDVIYADDIATSTHEQLYNELKNSNPYKSALRGVNILGTWDDHDYGVNNGGKEYVSKAQSQRAFLDFLAEPEDSQRRLQRGIYTSHEYRLDGRLVRILLLDVRYFRDQPGIEADILGIAQWRWLRKELLKTADLTILVSGTQVIPEDHSYERWDEYPEARRFLFELLDDSRSEKLLLLSGDRHFGEISQHKLKKKKVFELTSSGMTHPWRGKREEFNRYRIGAPVTGENFGVVELNVQKTGLNVAVSLKNAQGKVIEKLQF